MRLRSTSALQLRADKQAVVQKNEQLTAWVLSLQEQLNLALARRYAASSEKLSPDQIRLFDEAETETLAAAPAEDETVFVPAGCAHSPQTRSQKRLPRSIAEVPKRLLEGFQGYLQTDGYDG